MRILFLTDNFPPEINAPANRTYDHCKEWAKSGVKVTVITCAPNFPNGKVFAGYKNKLWQSEIIDGIKVIRVWTYITANEGTLKRIIDYLSFGFMSFIVSLFVKTDLIVATSPQFFTAISGRITSFFKRKPWIMEVRDIWPESIEAVGALKNKRILSILEKIEKHLYKSAKKIVVVTDSFKLNLVKKGIQAQKIYVIKNGVYLYKFMPLPKNDELIKDLGLSGKFVVAYFGTHGMAHKLDFILKSAKKVEDISIHFLFVGDGAEKENLLNIKEKLGVSNVTMLSSVPKNDIQKFISIIDVALVNLKKSDTFKSVIPSKIFENVAMGKPILLGVQGETQKIIEEYHAGECFEPENEIEFLNKLYRIKDLTLKDLYKDSCLRLAKDFNRVRLAKEMLEVFQSK